MYIPSESRTNVPIGYEEIAAKSRYMCRKGLSKGKGCPISGTLHEDLGVCVSTHCGGQTSQWKKPNKGQKLL